MNPPDLGSSAPKIFSPEYYERMRRLESEGWWNEGMRRVAAMLLKGAGLPSEGRMLDIGCGSGQTMEWFRTVRRGWVAHGVDLAPEGVKAANLSGFSNVARASALDLPYDSAMFDFAITLDVLQHLPLGGGDVRALGEMRRVLKRGGYLFVRTNAQSFPVARDDLRANFHKYGPRELRGKLVEAGFEVVRLGRINALLGLAEIPREIRAGREQSTDYHGILAEPRNEWQWSREIKERWLRFEGLMVRAGLSLPLGRTIVALCRVA